MARARVSIGTEKSRAFCTADARVAFPSTLPPPSRAATSTARMSLENILPRRWSVTDFLCLIEDHLEWPDISAHPFEHPAMKARVAGQLRMERRGEQTALLDDDRAPVQ